MNLSNRFALALAALPLACAACAEPALECRPITAELSGRMADDVLGAWQSGDPVDPSVYRFDREGSFVRIDPPSAASNGAIHTGTWAVADNLLTLRTAATSRTAPIAVTATVLVGLGPDHQRSVCSGYGF